MQFKFVYVSPWFELLVRIAACQSTALLERKNFQNVKHAVLEGQGRQRKATCST